MLGGNSQNNQLASTEFITTAGAVNGPTLPEAVDRPCAVKFPDNGFIYLIGGDTGSSITKSSSQTNNVWVANPSNLFAGFTKGPSMMAPRQHHGCGTMSIGTKSIIVAAGGMNNIGYINTVFLASVEILDPLLNKWVTGK